VPQARGGRVGDAATIANAERRTVIERRIIAELN
jgi:hypothetical protein